MEELDIKALRRCLGGFVTGVTIITTFDKAGEPRGMTANSFTSVSLDPPLILVCVGNLATSFEAFSECEGFTVNVLREEQRSLSNLFASKTADKFQEVRWNRGTSGGPRFDESLAILDCDVEKRMQMGDHMILVGRVAAFDTNPARPLVFGQGSYISFEAQDEFLSPHKRMKTAFTCIAEFESRVLLVRDRHGWALPSVRLSSSSPGVASAFASAFATFGAEVEITFLYSVFEDIAQDRVNIIYRGILKNGPPETDSVRLFSRDDVPWPELSPEVNARMLHRFFQERAIARFGVYTQIDARGHVAVVEPTPVQFDTHLARYEAGTSSSPR